MKKFLLSAMLLSAMFIPSMAQQRTEAEAEAIAKAFMQNNGYNFNVTKSAKIEKVRAEKAGEITPFFIFNDTQKGGYVIVGGQEGMSDILAYSNDECFDVDDMPPSAAAWLEYYASIAIKAADNPEASKAEKKARAKAFLNSNFALRKSVPPLLGEIKFNQGTPYNNQCPKLTVTTIKNGQKSVESKRAVVGCSATAFGMIMRYWKYPDHATGSKTYTFNYDQVKNEDTKVNTSAKMTLSVNYDSVGFYDWDNILPTYRSGTTYSAEEAEAVSKLLYHCGVALGAGYGLGGTGATTDAHKYATYFGYDKNISSIVCKNYLDQPEVLRAMLADELSQGRPILGKGSNDPDKYNGHAYVCDGFDMNGLFHFNLGWDGSSNGYFEVAPVPTSAYGHQMTGYINVHPIGRLTPSEPTRRLIVEAGMGDFNEQSTNIKNAWSSLDTDKKYGESMICIATADTEDEAEAYLPGLSTVQGVIFDRCDTLTGRISTTAYTNVYKERVKVAAPAQIDVDAMYSSDSTMAVTVYTEFYKAFKDADFRMTFVYTEDNVKIDGTTYNYIARGSYPFTDCLPATIEYDRQYIFENEIPLPASITNTNNATLIVMLIDGKTGEIVNANTLDLKQVNTWKANQKPSFFGNGELLGESSSADVYMFDEEKMRMPFPIRINNPWYEKMPVEVIAEEVELAENANFEIKDVKATIAGEDAQVYKLIPNAVDSTMILYLNITDKFQSSKSTIKLSLRYNGEVVAQQTVNFDFIKSEVDGANAYTVRVKGTLNELISESVKDTMTTITLGGRICGKDIIYMRDSLKLNVIDLSKVNIVEGPGLYNSTYTTTDGIVGVRLFQGFDAQKIILPESVTTIDNYAFNLNKCLTRVVIGQNVTSIGNSAFSGCAVMERITIPASVTEIGRNAFKGCPIVCVICEGETPATLSSKVFDGADLANATLVVPTETAIASYKAAKQWKDFGNIITYDNYLTSIAPVAEEAGVSVKDGKIIIAGDAEVAIYTFTGKLAAAGAAGEYALPAGNYIVKVGNKAVKVRL